MKSILLSSVLILLSVVVYSQQNVLSYFTNSYLTSANSLNDLTAITNYRKQVSIPPIIPDELSNKKAYFKVSYKPSSTSTSVPGLIDVSFGLNNGTKSTIEKDFSAYFDLMLVDSEESDFEKEIVKNQNTHGGYFFKKSDNFIYFIIKSEPKQDRILALIKINNLTDAQKKAFAKDFILKTVFK